MSPEQRAMSRTLDRSDLKAARAWALKLRFLQFLACIPLEACPRFFPPGSGGLLTAG